MRRTISLGSFGTFQRDDKLDSCLECVHIKPKRAAHEKEHPDDVFDPIENRSGYVLTWWGVADRFGSPNLPGIGLKMNSPLEAWLSPISIQGLLYTGLEKRV